jgi:hypothetical protein
VRIEQRTGNGNEQRTFTNTTRIVTYVRDDPCFITGEFRAGDFCELLKNYRFVHVYKILSRSGATAQRSSEDAVFLCAAAPLREKYYLRIRARWLHHDRRNILIAHQLIERGHIAAH